jgi:hypothetical protein
LDRYRLPTLQLRTSYPLPTGSERPLVWAPDPGAPGPGLGIAGGRIVAFDLGSGQPVGAGARVDARGSAEETGAPLFWGRPGHPGQAVVLDRTSHLQLWDAIAGRQLFDIDFVPGLIAGQGQVAVVFDRAGRRMIVGNGGTVTVYDADSGEPVRDPIPLPDDANLAGVDADGYLVLYTYDSTVSLVDIDRGRASGSAKPLGTVLGGEVAPGSGWTATPGSDGVLPVEIPLTARVWFDRVCAASGARPFTPDELAALPAGVRTDPPCS